MNIFKNILRKYTCILDRYLFKEYIGPFTLAVAGFVIIGIVDILFTLVDLFVSSGVPFLIVFRLLIYKIPAIMVLFFPMAVLFAVMLIMIRMAKDNEITVLRSSGVSTVRILIPLFLVVILTSYLSYFTNEEIVPWANKVSDQLIRTTVSKTPPPDIVENIFFKDEADRYFYIKKVDSKEGIMQIIMIYELSSTYPRIISAKEAFWDKKTWTLRNGYLQEFNEDGVAEFTSKFSEMKIHVERDIQSFYTQQKTSREMDSRELKDKISTLEKGGISTKRLKVEYYMKKSIPAACFNFAIIGIAFCLLFVRSGKDWWGVIIAICVSSLTVGFYFFVMAVARSYGGQGVFTPFLGAWFPNILFGLLGMGIIGYQILKK